MMEREPEAVRLARRLVAFNDSQTGCNISLPVDYDVQIARQLLAYHEVVEAAREHVTDADMHNATYKLPSYAALYNALSNLDKAGEQ